MANYDDFRKAFMDEYWSREIQIQIWSQCLSIKQIPDNENFREHFATWATKLRHLEVPRLSEQEIVKNIAKHYPGYLRAILVSLPERTILAAMKILGEEGQNQRGNDNRNVPHNTGTNNQRDNQNSQNNPNTNNNQRNQYQGNRGRYNNWEHRPPPNNNNNQNNHQGEWRTSQRVNQISIDQINDNDTDLRRDNNPIPTPVIHTVNTLSTENKNVSPYIQCEIEGEPIRLLIDTGATISVLTKEVIDKMIRRNNKIPMFPVTGVQISNAIGKKICKIAKQIFCQCKIGDKFVFNNFIQIENLNERGIIGADILTEYKAQINFESKTIKWEIDKDILITPFAEKCTPRYTSINNMAITEEDGANDEKYEEKEKCDQLIKKYEQVFSNKPGRIKNLQCQIKIKEGEPIHQRPYPIPMSKLSKMDDEIQRMLDLNIIERSTSPWSSPIVGVEKRNGKENVGADTLTRYPQHPDECEKTKGGFDTTIIIAPPWPTEPREKRLLLQRLRIKYKRLFGPKYLDKDMIEILKPTKPIITSVAAGQYQVQKIEIAYEAPKSTEQLKIEAQYERKRSALRTKYKLEPTFTMPDTITAIPMGKDPKEHMEMSTCVGENKQALDDNPIHQLGEEEFELEIFISPEERQNIEDIRDTPPPTTVVSNRERKRLLWLSKIPKKTKMKQT
ncbi:hypothetical protein FRX31_009689 [Thalictrum thalictroides]|uniref:Peptidase A2 domain-containing protein n=1 Tax=Thalictrum thalictroides TaxID=46969 RepID=A0A7J6WTJ2_THATH|nr:hypothetical protein FRX31_009689 [Thalictrum thalictroides]